MRHWPLLITLAAASSLFSQVTPHLGLNVPVTGAQNWGTALNANSYILDGLATGYTSGWLIWPLSAKGQIYTFGTGPCALNPGANGLYLVADSTQACGLNWVSGGSGGSGTVNTGTAGQFGIYLTTGSAISGHTLVAADINALGTLSNNITGNATTATGVNIISTTPYPTAAGALSYLTTEFGIVGGDGANTEFYTYWKSNGTGPLAGNIVQWGSSSVPGLLVNNGISIQGSGTKVLTLLGSLTANDCLKTDGTNIVDAGAACGSGGGGTPAGAANTVQINGGSGFGAIALPSQDSILMANSSGVPGWGVPASGTGAICLGTACSGGTPYTFDLIPSKVGLLAYANTWTGLQGFTLPIILSDNTVSSLPACSSYTRGFSSVHDAVSPTYRGALTGGGTVTTPVFCDGTTWTSH